MSERQNSYRQNRSSSEGMVGLYRPVRRIYRPYRRSTPYLHDCNFSPVYCEKNEDKVSKSEQSFSDILKPVCKSLLVLSNS